MSNTKKVQYNRLLLLYTQGQASELKDIAQQCLTHFHIFSSSYAGYLRAILLDSLLFMYLCSVYSV